VPDNGATHRHARMGAREENDEIEEKWRTDGIEYVLFILLKL
jgi:hypothetical protein